MNWIIFLLLLLAACRPSEQQHVIAYVSQDQVYAEPILKEFTRQTGIEVRALYDSEVVKTVGLVNRLRAERQNPKCDLFWNNEELRTESLLQEGIVSNVTRFGFRSRRLVINTNIVLPSAVPKNFTELTNIAWRGKFVMAYPLFGTTASHFAALKIHWGEPRWTQWCKELIRNQVLLVDGNSAVVNFVASGHASIGLTDFDDIEAAKREGRPVAALPMENDCFVLQNSVSLVVRSPRRKNAEQLASYLSNEATIARLVEARAIEGVVKPTCITVSFQKVAAELEQTTLEISKIFVRN